MTYLNSETSGDDTRAASAASPGELPSRQELS